MGKNATGNSCKTSLIDMSWYFVVLYWCCVEVEELGILPSWNGLWSHRTLGTYNVQAVKCNLDHWWVAESTTSLRGIHRMNPVHFSSKNCMRVNSKPRTQNLYWNMLHLFWVHYRPKSNGVYSFREQLLIFQSQHMNDLKSSCHPPKVDQQWWWLSRVRHETKFKGRSHASEELEVMSIVTWKSMTMPGVFQECCHVSIGLGPFVRWSGKFVRSMCHASL